MNKLSVEEYRLIGYRDALIDAIRILDNEPFRLYVLRSEVLKTLNTNPDRDTILAKRNKSIAYVECKMRLKQMLDTVTLRCRACHQPLGETHLSKYNGTDDKFYPCPFVDCLDDLVKAVHCRPKGKDRNANRRNHVRKSNESSEGPIDRA